MSSLFTDFEKDAGKEAINRYVTTPTVEQLYEVDKKAIDSFLDKDVAEIDKKADEIKAKPENEVSGAEALYLRVAETFKGPTWSVEGNEGLFSTVWSLIKRFLNMIGNFFKWLGETFFGFGKRSKTSYNKLKAQAAAGEINYDTELKYPGSARQLINAQKYKNYPENLDWLRIELDFINKQAANVSKTFTEAKALFAKLQDKKASMDDVERFGTNVAKALGGTVDVKKPFRIAGTTWGTVENTQEKGLVFDLLTLKQTDVTEKSVFKVSKSVYDTLVTTLKGTSDVLMELADLSKKEKDLFGIKIKDEKDLQGMGKQQAYVMAQAFKALVSYMGFIKNAMSAIQRADTAAHDIMKKAFK